MTQLNLRVEKDELESWKSAAGSEALSRWIRKTLNAASGGEAVAEKEEKPRKPPPTPKRAAFAPIPKPASPASRPTTPWRGTPFVPVSQLDPNHPDMLRHMRPQVKPTKGNRP